MGNENPMLLRDEDPDIDAIYLIGFNSTSGKYISTIINGTTNEVIAENISIPQDYDYFI